MDEKEKRIEYRLEYQNPKENHTYTSYFDTVNDAYNFITENRIYTFQLVKEELVAQRYDRAEF